MIYHSSIVCLQAPWKYVAVLGLVYQAAAFPESSAGLLRAEQPFRPPVVLFGQPRTLALASWALQHSDGREGTLMAASEDL